MASIKFTHDHQLSASVVLHHSDLDRLRLTLTSLLHAAEKANVIPVWWWWIKSQDAHYSRQAQALVQQLWQPMGDAEFLITPDKQRLWGWAQQST